MLSSGGASHKNDFLAATRAARDARQVAAVQGKSAVVVQAAVRGWLARIATRRRVEAELRLVLAGSSLPATQLYTAARRFLTFVGRRNWELMETLLRSIVTSLESESLKLSYIGVFLNKTHSVAWIEHVKQLCRSALAGLKEGGPEQQHWSRRSALLVLTLISFTSTASWRVMSSPALASLAPHMSNICSAVLGSLVEAGLLTALRQLLLAGLAGPSPLLSRTTTTAALTLSLRPVQQSGWSEQLVSLYLLHILSIPGLVHQAAACPAAPLLPTTTLQAAVALLSQQQQLRIHFNALEGSYALCLTANLVELVVAAGPLDPEPHHQLVTVLTSLLAALGQYVTAKQSPLSHWHPVLGWFSVSLDRHLQASLATVRAQLARLWAPDCLALLTADLRAQAAELPAVSAPALPAPALGPPDNAGRLGVKLVRGLVERTRAGVAAGVTLATPPASRLGSPASTRVARLCTLYTTACSTLTQLRADILNGLCYGDLLLRPLWVFLNSLGPQCGLKSWLELLSVSKAGTAPEFQILILYCDTLAHLVSILDDSEFYGESGPGGLSVAEYAMLGSFLNMFLYRGVMAGQLSDPASPLFSSLLGLLGCLRRRDDRRPFVPAGHWLVRELRLGSLLSDLEKGRPAARLLLSALPHTIPHQDRVLLFRKKVAAERAALGLSTDLDSASPQSTLISVHRSRLLEDGYRQLGRLGPTSIKGLIRVRFVNMQGLDEAGIDQDGVFKEFLEETIKKVFDPGLNLFCTTSEERLYPSPLSHLTENHLDLFEFVGKMIGKAVYEGIVVDVPFASFFLSQILGHDHSALYSYLDEMSSSDPELHRNLTYVKHYEGDVEDLGLTFSFDQDSLGRLVTHELIPGGRAINVTNSNRISYIHQMAHFKMRKQISAQVAATRTGFRSVINPEWLEMFSGPEVQRLISGDNSPVDLRDLRRNTSYYGGFHDSHRVVAWLWDILERDFSDKERSMFLKFVTSCSKPPLLGFENLEPPFSIRCVEVADDEDDGDTVGSVLRGFLALRKKDPVNRLPTASTCFNLLKLPNYQKKSTLREKLRYAISCNTGFELS